MNIRYLWKDSNSITGECPALYEVPGGEARGYVVQGKKLTADVLEQVGRSLSDGEDAVFVPANVLDRLWEDRTLCSDGSLVLAATDTAGAPGYIVRGSKVGGDVLGQLQDVADDEAAVFVAAEALDQGKILA